MSRFDYVAYDDLAKADQVFFKNLFEDLETQLQKHSDIRAKSLALTALEEAYMWVGKMIRDEQIVRNPKTYLQEERSNS